MAIGYIRETVNFNTGPGTTVTPVAAVAAGTLMVLYVSEGLGSGTSTVTISDTRSNTWTRFVQGGAGSESTTSTVSGWYAVANSTNTVTVTVTPTASTSIRASLTEYSGTWGATPFVSGRSSASAGTGPRNTGTVTPTAADALLVAHCFAPLGAAYSSAGTGFTLLTLTNSRSISAYRIVTASGPYSAEFVYTASARTTGAAIGAFVEASLSLAPIGSPVLQGTNGRAGDSSVALDVTLGTALPTGSLALCAVWMSRLSAAIAAPTSVSGGGVTWELVVSQYWKTSGTGHAALYVYRAASTTPSGTTVTVTPSSVVHTMQVAVVTIAGAKVGTNGAEAIIQNTGTSLGAGNSSIAVQVNTLTDPVNNGFLAFGAAIGTSASYTWAPDTSPVFTELYDNVQDGGTRVHAAFLQYCISTPDVNPIVGATLNTSSNDGLYLQVLEVASATVVAMSVFRPYFITG